MSLNSEKLVRSLHHKKYRNNHNKFILEGKRTIDFATNYYGNFSLIIYTKNFSKQNPELISKIKCKSIEIISEKEMEKLSPSKSPSGIIAISNMIDYGEFNNNKNVVFLDKVSDPGNMGTIIRTAAWFGIYQIALSPGCIDPYNPKVVRSAMGSHFSLSWMGEKDISTLNNYELIGADQNSKNNKLGKLIDNWALVMGSESHGLSKKTLSYLDQSIGITKIGSGESLNIGVAMGILLHKMTK